MLIYVKTDTFLIERQLQLKINIRFFLTHDGENNAESTDLITMAEES